MLGIPKTPRGLSAGGLRAGLTLFLVLTALCAVARAQEPGEGPRELLTRLSALPDDSLEERIALGERILADLVTEPDAELELEAHFQLGLAHILCEQYERARYELAEGARLAAELGDDMSRMMCITNQLLAENMLGEFEAALELATEGVALAQRLKRPDVEWKLANGRGVIHERRGDFELALESYVRALGILEQLADREGIGHILNNIGVSYNNLGQPESAFEFLDRAVQIFEGSDNVSLHATALANLADSLSLSGSHGDALELQYEALRMRVACCPGLSLVISHNSIAKIHLRTGAFEEAIQQAEQGLAITRDLALPGEGLLSLSILAQAYTGLDRGAEAIVVAEQSLNLRAAIERKGLRLGSLEALTKAHRSQGNFEEALAALERAITVEREIRSLAAQQSFSEFRARFRDSEKERKIALLQKDNEIQSLELARQDQLRNSLLVGAGLLLILGAMGWTAYLRIRRTDRALLVSEHHYQTLCSLSPVGVFRADASGELIFVNRRWSEITGLTREQATGEGWLKAIHTDDQQRVGLEWSHRVTKSALFQSDYRIERPQGDIVNVLGQAAPELGVHGLVTGYVGTITDLTTQHRMEEKVREAQKLSGIGMLAGGIAHDFNNILASIIGNASLAQEDLAQDAGIEENLNAIIRAAEHAAELCSQLLAYAGKGQFQIEAVDVNAAVQEMSELLRVTAGPKTALRVELSPGLAPVRGDATQIRQVVLNLMTNAAEALKDHSGRVTLSTRATTQPPLDPIRTFLRTDPAPDAFVVLRIQDDGCGFDQEVGPQLFDPFFTTKIAGHGLGMAAVLGIVRSHCGAICIESTLAEGTTVEVYLPSTLEQIEPLQEASVLIPQPRRCETILVVDDNADIRHLASETLKRSGFDVLTAADGIQALAVFEKAASEIGLVLLDAIMPNMDGIEAYLELRSLRADLPVILTSGYTEEDSMGRLGKNGGEFVRFLKKPYRPSELVAMVNALTGNRDSEALLRG